MSNGPPITVNRLLRASYMAFMAAGVFSFAVNVLMLTLPIFMFQVFDRVLSSRSEATLVMLLLMATAALIVQAGLDAVRAFVFVRVSSWIDRRVGPMLMSSIIVEALDRSRSPNSGPLRSLSTLRMFLTGPGMLTMLDVPWVPVFLLVIFWVNPAMGWAAIGGAVVMFAIGLMNDRMTRRTLMEAQMHSAQSFQAAESAVRNAAVVEAMGMRSKVLDRWSQTNEQVLSLQGRASDRAAIFQGISKSARMLVQMVIMSVAVLQIIDPSTPMTPGMMIAAVMILGRALQPVEMGINQARQMFEAIAAYKIVEQTLQNAQAEPRRMELPAPKGLLSAENLGHQPQGVARPILQRVSFEVLPGEMLAVIGPSAAGKSTLARLLVGVEKPTVGNVRLDGADVYQWNSDELGPHIGYMPQDIELFSGTVAENIGRLDPSPDSAAVIKAAELAGLHEQILRLAEGYDTQIGNAGAILSGGQRQRVALARALYGDPSLVVLDEPNSNLDNSGDDALGKALLDLKERGATVIMITHRPQTLGAADKVLVLQNGIVQRFGPRDEVMNAGAVQVEHKPGIGELAPPSQSGAQQAGKPEVEPPRPALSGPESNRPAAAKPGAPATTNPTTRPATQGSDGEGPKAAPGTNTGTNKGTKSGASAIRSSGPAKARTIGVRTVNVAAPKPDADPGDSND